MGLVGDKSGWRWEWSEMGVVGDVSRWGWEWQE